METMSTLPEYERKSFARWLAKAAERYFEDPEVQKRFEEWKREQNNEN